MNSRKSIPQGLKAKKLASLMSGRTPGPTQPNLLSRRQQIPTRFLIRWIGHPAHKQDAVGAVVANQEDKRVVSAENRWGRRVRGANRHGPHGHGGGRCSLGSFFIHVAISLMDHRRNREILLARHS